MLKTHSPRIIRIVAWHGIFSVLCLVFSIYFLHSSPRSWFLRGLLFGNSVTSTIIVAMKKDLEVRTEKKKDKA